MMTVEEKLQAKRASGLKWYYKNKDNLNIDQIKRRASSLAYYYRHKDKILARQKAQNKIKKDQKIKLKVVTRIKKSNIIVPIGAIDLIMK